MNISSGRRDLAALPNAADGRSVLGAGSSIPSITLRPARITDAYRLWRWRNDDETRAQSWQTDHVGLWVHLVWLRQALRGGGGIRLFMAWEGEQPVGTGRLVGNELSLTVAPEHRGRGVGTAIVRALVLKAIATPHGRMRLRAIAKPGNAAVIRAFQRAGGRTRLRLRAVAKPGNAASIRAFQRAGFCIIRSGPEAVTLELDVYRGSVSE